MLDLKLIFIFGSIWPFEWDSKNDIFVWMLQTKLSFHFPNSFLLSYSTERNAATKNHWMVLFNLFFRSFLTCIVPILRLCALSAIENLQNNCAPNYIAYFNEIDFVFYKVNLPRSLYHHFWNKPLRNLYIGELARLFQIL